MDKIIETKRLLLRQWRPEDLAPLAKLNADPRVREFFPNIKTFEESAQEYGLIKEECEKAGFGFWATSLSETGNFIGFIGLHQVNSKFPFAPAVEIGWRLDFDFWGKGYATEGSRAALSYGFNHLKLEEIVSFTSTANVRSRNVMEKIGMHRSPKDDFDHPFIAEGHPLRRHVLYRLQREQWINHV